MDIKFYQSLHKRLMAGQPPEVTAEEAVRIVSITNQCHALGEKGWTERKVNSSINSKEEKPVVVQS